MNDILNMATLGAACSDKRREDDLHGELEKMEYKISRSVLYLWLLSRDASTSEGRRHHNTVPVRLVRPDEYETSRKNVREGRLQDGRWKVQKI